MTRTGYKQTETGPIPDSWSAKKLGELASFRTGPFGSALHKSDYALDCVPLINPMHISDGRIYPSANITVTESAARALAEFRLKPGELVIGRRGDMGRCAVVREEQAGWLCGTGSMIIRPQRNLDPGYCQRVLSSHRAILAIENSSVGSTMVNLNQGTLSQLVIPAPPLVEQRAIAAALADADASLEKLDALIAKKRDLRQAAMQQLFSASIRLPGFRAQWSSRRLDALAEIRGGSTPSTANPEYWDGDVHWCTPTDITELNGAKYLRRTNRTITESGLMASAADLIPPGAVVMTSRATIGACAINKVPLATNQGFKNFVPRADTDVEFLYYLLQTKRQEFIALCSGSTFLEIGKSQLSRVTVQVPSMREQIAIAHTLSGMDDEIGSLEARREKVLALKAGMMQALLTGEIRLL